jgi:hypothetical protein
MHLLTRKKFSACRTLSGAQATKCSTDCEMLLLTRHSDLLNESWCRQMIKLNLSDYSNYPRSLLSNNNSNVDGTVTLESILKHGMWWSGQGPYRTELDPATRSCEHGDKSFHSIKENFLTDWATISSIRILLNKGSCSENFVNIWFLWFISFRHSGRYNAQKLLH